MQYPEILLTKLNLLHTYVLAKVRNLTYNVTNAKETQVVPEGSIEYAMLLARVADNLTEFPHGSLRIISMIFVVS